MEHKLLILKSRIALSHCKKIKLLEKSVGNETNDKARAEMENEINSARSLLQELAAKSEPEEYARLYDSYVQTYKSICPKFRGIFS